ncbi:MAG: hypothetical protein R3B70_17195 [Polyangiaceae bacterium]
MVFLEGEAAGDELVEEHAAGVHVGAAVDGAGGPLLGGHVAGGADDAAGTGEIAGEGALAVGELDVVGDGVVDGDLVFDRGVAAAHRLGDAEVDQLDALAGGAREHDVLGLDVAVDEAKGVRFGEGAADLGDDAGGAIGLDAALHREELAEVGALDELHREVDEAAVHAVRDDLHRVRVVDAAHDGGLAAEAGEHAGLAHAAGVHDLHGEIAARLGVAGAEHGAHGALAEALGDLQGAFERAADQVVHGVSPSGRLGARRSRWAVAAPNGEIPLHVVCRTLFPRVQGAEGCAPGVPVTLNGWEGINL